MNPPAPIETEINPTEQQQAETEMQNMLQIMFVRKNQNKFNEIEAAISAGDIVLAHRLSHTLKGNAGQIGQTKLQEIAEKVEKRLKVGELVAEEDLVRLKTQLISVLDELEPLCERNINNVIPLDSEQALVLFEKLKFMLERLDPGCLDLVDELKTITGTEKLVAEIEEFNLRAACKILLDLVPPVKSRQ